MYVVCVTVFVKSGHEEAFIKATGDNHHETRKESGNLRFDVLRVEDDATKFFLYEVYKNKEAFIEHQKTPYYTRWKETVAPWMAQPRVGVKHYSVYPADEAGAWLSNS
jgi:autoinducer 2-degrading protein